MFISITRLRLRSWFFLPSFFIATGKIVKQAKESAGFVEGATFADKKLAFWTVTLWSDGAAMKVFRGQAAHKNSMPSFANWCDEGCVAHWETNESMLPYWGEINKQMVALGRPSPVKYPSVDHAAMKFPAPANGEWRTRKFKAAKST